MKQYKYELMKGSRRYLCPKCGKKEFKVYVKTGTNIVVDSERFGRCNRQNSCGYHRYPDNNDDWTPPQFVYTPPKPLDYVSKDVVEATFNQYKTNVFFMFLVKTFGMEVAYQLRDDYNIGTAKGGGIIYWQQDNRDRFRTGKVMYYNSNGRRNKDRMSWFVHKQIAEDFNYRQCFFGLHLVDGEKPVALCESEKTAVMMSVFMPEYTWVASGGSEMLNLQRLNELPRLDMVFPDNRQFDKWEQKTRIFSGRQMDLSVDMGVGNGLISEGDDILDLWFAKQDKEKEVIV